jgi:hypothetical protein
MTILLPRPEVKPITARMHCDHAGCARQVRRAPRILVPSKTPFALGHAPIRIMTTLHYCEIHRLVFDPASYFTDAVKTMVEARARILRPIGFQCDFEQAVAVPVLVTTPEYRAFLQEIGVRVVVE